MGIVMAGQGPHVLNLILTSRCNLACSYCYQNSRRRQKLSWPAARAGLDRLLASDHHDLAINFVGGEALLEEGLLRRAVAHVERHRPVGKQIRYSIGTNGTLLTEELAAFLAEHRFATYLSFDGVPEAQRLRGAGTFVKLDRLLDRLRRRQPAFFRLHLNVTITLLTTTLRYLPASVRYFLAKGVQHIGISPESTDTAGWEAERIAELEAAFEEVLEDCLRHYAQSGEVPLKLFRHRGGERAPRVQGRSMCGVGRGESLTVDADGRAYGCVLFARSYQTFTPFLEERLRPMELGAVDAPGFDGRLRRYPAAARQAEIFDRKEDKYSSYGRCGECRYLATCGVCPVSIGRQSGNRDPRRVPDFLCAYNLVWHRFRDRFPALPGVPETAAVGALPLMDKIGLLADLRRQHGELR